MSDKPPNYERVISAIHEGSKISALTQSVAKRHARELNRVNSTFVCPAQTPLGYELSFTYHDMQGLVDPHHDALVITLQIANYKLKPNNGPFFIGHPFSIGQRSISYNLIIGRPLIYQMRAVSSSYY